jgi:hypothetical protein
MITGECYCGTIRYQIAGALQNARACHCSRCRKVFGGASSAYGELRAVDEFSWTSGQEQLTQHTAANGWGIGFCRHCGSTLCVLFQGQVQGVTLGAVNGDPGCNYQCTFSWIPKRLGITSVAVRLSSLNGHRTRRQPGARDAQQCHPRDVRERARA